MIKTIINSTLGLSSGLLLTIILHEIAHYALSYLLGYETTLFHNYVYLNSIETIFHEIIIAGIAPVFSLIMGAIAYLFAKKMAKSAVSLFFLWFGLAGMITFFGYLMIAPLLPIGDTGKVLSLLNVPLWVQVLLSLVAIILLTLILIKSTKEFEQYAIEDFGSNSENRKKWSVSLILIPLIVSVLVTTILQFPIPHIASILATVCSPFSIMAVFGSFIGSKKEIGRDLKGRSVNDKISIPLIIIFVLIVIVNRILVNGI